MESPGEREPQPTPPPASLRPPPSTPPPPSIPATDPPSLTPAASSEQVLEALLGAGDEELLDWGDESPVHIYSQACAGEDAEHPRSGPSSPAPAKLVPIEVPGGSAPAAGGSGGSATAAAMDISICSPPDLRKQGATRAEGAALATAEGSGKAMASSSTTPATQPGENLYCSPDSRWEMGAPAGVIAGQEEPISPKWQHAKVGRRSRAPPVPHPDTAASKPAPRGSPSAAFAAFKKRFAGRKHPQPNSLSAATPPLNDQSTTHQLHLTAPSQGRYCYYFGATGCVLPKYPGGCLCAEPTAAYSPPQHHGDQAQAGGLRGGVQAGVKVSRWDGERGAHGPRPPHQPLSDRGQRRRDYLPHAAEEWERRRSRSPMRQNTTGEPSELHQAGSVSHDPLADPHSTTTTPASHFLGHHDPMMLEANCRAVLPSASPCPCPDDGAPLGAAGWGVSTDSAVVDLAVMASPAAEENIINEDTDLQGAEDTEGCTETEDNGDCASFCRKMFRKVPEPLLPRPASPQVVKKQADQSSTRRRRRTLAPTRSSLRQATRPSPVPVAQRAQLKLMRELDFINGEPRAPDAAITEYVDSFGHDLPEKAIKALRTTAKMDNKELCKALAAIAAELGGDEIVVP
ncbi:unnamed protein product [Miscanthus lutarioriparius]|uniref:Uncharacterized protein n=1 Tax=Miscanthus lutarioriparius TaxID=422564 RepID=A0A811RG09_9POAL|nr:unnamed protein product [Miscanthus lutarioriparius]